MSKRTISEARMRRYFLGSGVYTNALILIILGVGIIAASFAIHSLIVGLAGGGVDPARRYDLSDAEDERNHRLRLRPLGSRSEGRNRSYRASKALYG